MEKPAWMYDDMVKDIDEKKLTFLGSLVEGGKGKSQREMMPFFLGKMKESKSLGISYSPAEINLVIEAIKKHSSEDELQKIDEIMKKAPH